MLRMLSMTGLLVTVLALMPNAVQAQKNKAKKGKDAVLQASADDYAALAKVTQVQGKLTEFDPAARQFTIRIDIPHSEPNPNYKPPKTTNTTTANRQIAGVANHANHLQQRMAQLQQQM